MFVLKNIKVKDILVIDELVIEEKKVNVILGESGSGKTTFLKLLNKLISPDEGDIFYREVNIKDIDSLALRREVTMLTQNSPLFPDTIRDNLIKGLELQNKIIPSDQVLEEYLRLVYLNKKLDDRVVNLSGGEKSRIALARVLILDSEVYLLDEPSAALDRDTEEYIIKMIVSECRKNSKTIIMVTHSRDVALKYGDIIFDMENKSCRKRS